MSTTLLTGQQTYLPYAKGGNALSLVTTAATPQPAGEAERLLHLGNQLQSSLEVEEILARFSEEIQIYLPHNSLQYRQETADEQARIEFAVGKTARHRLHYQLTINKQDLGSLEISRKTKFTSTETTEAEHLICALLYPLRNALMYRAAIQAARKDGLTGAGNRAAFDEALQRQVELAQRHSRTLGMIIVDIDHFKKINDTYGHAVGDSLLKTLAQTTSNTVRLSDQVFRYGGEEFVVLLPETSKAGIRQLAERIRRNIENVECLSKGQHIKMTASFGVAILKDDETEREFFNRADQALYKAKASGRNCTCMAE